MTINCPIFPIGLLSLEVSTSDIGRLVGMEAFCLDNIASSEMLSIPFFAVKI